MMKTTKRRLEFFSFYDHTGIEAHLERMAQKGWLLEKIGNFTWHYRRIEPQALTFSVCYFPKASLFDPGPSEEQEMFYDFCRHTGWTLAAASAQMQVFYNERANPVPIDTDPALEVDAIHKSAKKSFLLSQGLLAAVAVMNSAMFLLRLRDDPIRTLSSPASVFLAVCWPMLFLMIGVDVGSYFWWRFRARKAAAQGRFLETKSHPVFQKICLVVVMAVLLWWLFAMAGEQSPTVAVLTGLLIAAYALSVGLVLRVRELLKRRKASAESNRAVTIAACVGLSILLTAAVPFIVINGFGYDRNAHAVHPDDPVLRMEDLMETDYDYYRNDWQSQSPLLACFEANQAPWKPEEIADAPSLSYTAAVVKFPPVYDVCKNHLLYENDTRETGFQPVKCYAPIVPAPWGAQEAYQFVMDGEAITLYLLCYEDRIVKLRLDWEPAPGQMAIVGEKLGGA